MSRIPTKREIRFANRLVYHLIALVRGKYAKRLKKVMLEALQDEYLNPGHKIAPHQAKMRRKDKKDVD